jgi:hypothetical protein
VELVSASVYANRSSPQKAYQLAPIDLFSWMALLSTTRTMVARPLSKNEKLLLQLAGASMVEVAQVDDVAGACS